ncbi:MAG: BBE domain-containing protein [Streptosporangiaceae bacterium]
MQSPSALRRHIRAVALAARSYVNNLSAEDGRKVRHIWGTNYARLVQIKRRYDPGNIFRLNDNIDPSGQAAAALAPA